MAGEKYIEAAVQALVGLLRGFNPPAPNDYSTGAIATQLAALELAQALPPGSIPRPAKIIAARVPRDNATPLVAVFDVADRPEQKAGQRNSFHLVDCSVVVAIAMGGIDPEALERLRQRYLTAIAMAVKTSNDDGTWGAATTPIKGISGAWLLEGGVAPIGDKSSMRLAHAKGVQMRVHTP